MFWYYLQSQMNKVSLISKNLSPFSWWETCIYCIFLCFCALCLPKGSGSMKDKDWSVGVVQVIDNNIWVNVGKGWFPLDVQILSIC